MPVLAPLSKDSWCCPDQLWYRHDLYIRVLISLYFSRLLFSLIMWIHYKHCRHWITKWLLFPKSPWANFIHNSLLFFFIFCISLLSSPPSPSLLSLLLLPSFSSIKRIWFNTGVAAREFVREWKVLESSLFASFTPADRGGRRAHERWWDPQNQKENKVRTPHPPYPTRPSSSLGVCMWWGRQHPSAWRAPQMNRSFYLLETVSDLMQDGMSPLSFHPSYSPLLLSPCLCCCCLFKFTGLQMYMSTTTIKSIHIFIAFISGINYFC